jgi:hypothetical protein
VKIAYFVHDLWDSAVEKRVRMLQAGGLEVVLAGFWRGENPPERVAGVVPIPFGRTYDARFPQRCKMVVVSVANARSIAKTVGAVDMMMARSLEVLAVAQTARAFLPGAPPVAYEILDIHRLALSDGVPGKVLRFIERRLMRGASLLISSSPAFFREYFEKRQFSVTPWPGRTLLVENKALDLTPAQTPAVPVPMPGAPWRIGWFGMIRCRRSLDQLCDLARRRPDLVEVIIRGRPSYTEFEDFDAQVQNVPGVAFGGVYRQTDLPALYGEVHFNWAIDYFETGGNSEWLLPNRIYEGGRFDAVPLAASGNETARWLEHNGLGVCFDNPLTELEGFLDRLTPESYSALKMRSQRAPRSLFVAGHGDCDRLAQALRDMRSTNATAQTTLSENKATHPASRATSANASGHP